MPENQRKKYHHGDLRRALIEAGLAEIEEKGVDALSLRSIAARVGVSHTAPKNHFDGLRGLLTAIAARGFEMQVAEMRGPVAETRAADGLGGPGDGYLRFALSHPELYKLMFSRTLTDGSDPALRRASGESYALLRDIAADLGWDDPAAADGTRRTEWLLWSLVHGYAMLLIEGELDRNPDGSLVYRVADLLRGVGGARAR